MSNGWTPERRARQGALIQGCRPWKKSTGPRTSAGKATAAQSLRVRHGGGGRFCAESATNSRRGDPCWPSICWESIMGSVVNAASRAMEPADCLW